MNIIVGQNIPKEVNNLIERYSQLNIGGQKVRAPYYRNVKRVRAELRSLVGKGSPEEMEEETLIYAKLRGFSLDDTDEGAIREFMQSQGIGIDCSGLITHLYDKWCRSQSHGSLYSHLKFPKASFYRKFIRWLRPIENISADILTNKSNAERVELKDIKIGDLIRLKGLQRGDHVALVTEVSKEEGKLQSFKYVHSSPHYGSENGIRIGEVEITDMSKELKDQKWKEVDENGICWTLKELEKDYQDNGLRRLKFVK